MDTFEKIAELERRIEDLELNADNGILNLFVTGLPKESRATFFQCVEQGVANYFGLSREMFFDNLIGVGNKYGRKGRTLPIDPVSIHDETDRLIVARFILYAIIHIDFCIPIVELSEWYSLKVKNYIREWKSRYIRIFHSEGSIYAANDEAYKKYWIGCHAEIIKECERAGLYNQLIERLKRFDLDNNLDDIYLVKWRIDI